MVPDPPAAPAQERIAEDLAWQWAVRADLSVARHLLGGEEPDGVYSIGVSTVTDRFFCWLDEIGALGELASMSGVGIKRQVIPFETWVMLYFLRCLARCPSQNSLPDPLFSDIGLMKIEAAGDLTAVPSALPGSENGVSGKLSLPGIAIEAAAAGEGEGETGR